MRADKRLSFASIASIAKLFRQRKLSPLELTRFLLNRIAALNPLLNAFITVCEESALEQAARAESELCVKARSKSRRDRGPLHGIPISIKDNIYTRNVRTTAGSRILRDFVPLHDARVVTALKKAGAIILGKTNMHEFAYGVTSNNPHYGSVKNPWDPSRIAGGSSGGSAAAVAAGLSYGSIGTDTGGSIRIPASLCGIVGLKPGPGRVSTSGVVPLSTTLDFAGPLARTSEDVALLLEAICTTARTERGGPLRDHPSPQKQRKRLGVPKEFFFDIVGPEVAIALERAIRVLESRNTQLKEVSVPMLQQTEDAGNQIAWAEATLYHQSTGWFPQRASDYGEDVRSRLEMGAKVSAVAYLQALEIREKFVASIHKMFQESEVHALVVPTTPITATRITEEFVSIKNAEHSVRALLLRLNRPANLAGVPAVSVPCGLSENGLPAGLQFIGATSHERMLLELARGVQESCPLETVPRL